MPKSRLLFRCHFRSILGYQIHVSKRFFLKKSLTTVGDVAVGPAFGRVYCVAPGHGGVRGGAAVVVGVAAVREVGLLISVFVRQLHPPGLTRHPLPRPVDRAHVAPLLAVVEAPVCCNRIPTLYLSGKILTVVQPMSGTGDTSWHYSSIPSQSCPFRAMSEQYF